MTKTEFLSLTDVDTGEPVYVSPEQIELISQLPADEDFSRCTMIRLNGYHCFVKEEASQIALASGRGLQDIQPQSNSAEPFTFYP